MKNKKGIKKITLLTMASSLFSLGNVDQSFAQTNLAQATTTLNLRSGPNANDSIICTINKGTRVEILNALGQWTKVKYLNHIGFVSTQYLENVVIEENITLDENKSLPSDIKIMECGIDVLDVRFAPSVTEKILGTLKKGDKVEVLYEVNRNWARIKYNTRHGYVKLQYLTDVNSNAISFKPTVMYCNAASLNIRINPSSKDLVIDHLQKGDIVHVVEFLDNGWARIKYNNSYAYVSSQQLSKSIITQNTSDSNSMICAADIVNVRSGPSSSESIIGQIKENDKVEVIYHVSTGWTKIKYLNRHGYVNTNYLTCL